MKLYIDNLTSSSDRGAERNLDPIWSLSEQVGNQYLQSLVTICMKLNLQSSSNLAQQR
jgi:hypothetical protein